MKRGSLPSKNRLLVTIALAWGIPMCAMACAALWKYGGLTASTAFGVIIMCVLCSLGFAAIFVSFIEKKHGPFKDE